MHGGEFNGNQCRRLLNNIYLLEVLLENAKIGFEGGKLIAAFKTFNAVRQTCFGNVLNSSYRDSTFSFERAYKALEISITPKDFGVSKVLESVHTDFIRQWETGANKPNLGHLEYCKKLKNCTFEYCSRHL